MPVIPGVVASSLTSRFLAPVLWLDASNDSSFTFSSGSTISQWTDRSANAYTFTQATTANQPTRTGTQNGKSTVVFDGVNDVLTSTAAASVWKFLHNGSGATVFMVAKQTRTTTSTYNRVLSTVNFGISSDIGIAIEIDSATPLGRVNRYSTTVNGSTTLPNLFFDSTFATTHAVQTIVFDQSNATPTNRIIQYLNNNSSVTAFSNSFVPSGSNPTSTLQLGNDGVNYAPLQGEIAEIIIYSSVLSDANRNATILYLINKWGI